MHGPVSVCLSGYHQHRTIHELENDRACSKEYFGVYNFRGPLPLGVGALGVEHLESSQRERCKLPPGRPASRCGQAKRPDLRQK